MPLFKQSILLQAVVILLAMAALWAGAVANPQPMPLPQGSDVLYGVLYGWLSRLPGVAVALAIVLVLTGGVLLNIILVDIGLSSQNSLLPTLLYVICMSAPATTLTPMTIVALLMIACMRLLSIKGTLLTIPLEKACTTTALIGICSMFYLPAALLILSYLLVAINYRLYSWRDWSVMLLGFIAPYSLQALVLMFNGGLEQWWMGVVEVFSDIHLNVGEAHLLQIIGCSLLAIALVAGIVAVSRRAGESTVLWQRNAVTMISTLVAGMAMMVVSRVFPIDMQFFVLPFTFGVSCLLLPQRSTSFGARKRHEWVYTLILVLIFISAVIC